MVRRNIALQSTALTFVIQPANGTRRYAFAENSPAPSDFAQGDVTERAVPGQFTPATPAQVRPVIPGTRLEGDQQKSCATLQPDQAWKKRRSEKLDIPLNRNT